MVTSNVRASDPAIGFGGYCARGSPVGHQDGEAVRGRTVGEVTGHRLILRDGWASFVGVDPLPMRHGLTMGELGHWFIATPSRLFAASGPTTRCGATSPTSTSTTGWRST